jgi:uncharacterized protein YdeI (YjbR/CyaY-like superfamily)
LPIIAGVEIGKTLKARTRSEWRRWLKKNHATASEIWLVFFTKASGKKFVPYDDAVEEALCFGWIDGIVKKLEADSRAQRFTPRRPGRPVSELNKERMRRMIEAGKMTEAGLAAAPDLHDKFEVADWIVEELKADPVVWRNFQRFPEAYRRIRVAWIQNTTGNDDVRRQRLDYLIKMTRQGKQFGRMP